MAFNLVKIKKIFNTTLSYPFYLTREIKYYKAHMLFSHKTWAFPLFDRLEASFSVCRVLVIFYIFKSFLTSMGFGVTDPHLNPVTY